MADDCDKTARREYQAEFAAAAGVRWSAAPLRRAADAGDAEMVKELLDAGSDPNDASDAPGGWTVLMTAVEAPHAADVVRALLDGGADPNRSDARGQTAMHVAVDVACMRAQDESRQPDWGLVAMLEARGADRRAGTRTGQTPADFAAAYGFELPPRPGPHEAANR